MDALTHLISEDTIRQIGWTLLHFLWQGAAIAALLWGTLKILQKASANARYLGACLALALMVAAPAVTFILLDADTPASIAESAAQPTTEPAAPAPAVVRTVELSIAEPADTPEPTLFETLIARLESVLPVCVFAWLAGVTALCLWYLGGWCQLQRLRRIGTKPVPQAVAEKCAHLADRLGIRKAVRLAESVLVQVPTVIGHLRPVILLPATALTGLDELQLQAMIAHELAHIRRGDYLVNIAQTVVEILGFYHPAVWWVSRRIRIERENACDDVAIALVQNRKEYAKALFSMEAIRAKQHTLALAASGAPLTDRIRRIAGKDTHSPNSGWIPSVITIFLMAAVLVTAAIAMNEQSKTNTPPTKQQIQSLFAEADAALKSKDLAKIGQCFYFENDSIRQQALEMIEQEEVLSSQILQSSHILDIQRQPDGNIEVFLLLPVANTFFTPHRMVMVPEKHRYKLWMFNQDVVSMYYMTKTKTAQEIRRIIAEKRLTEWENASGEDLEKLVQSLIHKEENNLAAWEYAQTHNLELPPHLMKEEIQKRLNKYKDTPPEQLQQELLAEWSAPLEKRDPTSSDASTSKVAQSPIDLNVPDNSIERVARLESMNRLRQLGVAYVMFRDDNDEKTPDTLEALRPYLDNETRQWINENDNMVLLPAPKDLTSVETMATPIACDKTLLQTQTGAAVLFADGHVEFVEKPMFDQMQGKIQLSNRLNSAVKMRTLGAAMHVYLFDHDEVYPARLDRQFADLVDIPYDDWLANNVELLVAGENEKKERANQIPIAYDKALLNAQNATNVLFADGHVEFVPKDKLGEYGIAAQTNLTTLNGHVFMPDGTPFADAWVLPMPHGGEPVRTDAQGRFQLPGPSQDPAVDRRIDFLLVRHPQTNLAAVADLAAAQMPMPIQLQPALTLTGRVTDPAGHPIGDARVSPSARYAEVTAWFGYTPFDRTMANGTFEIPALPVEPEYTLHVSASGYEAYQERLGQFTNPGRIELDTLILQPKEQTAASDSGFISLPGGFGGGIRVPENELNQTGEVRGTIIESNGDPVGQVKVWIRQILASDGSQREFFRSAQPDKTTMSDENGQFTIKNVPANSRIWLEVNHPEFAVKRIYLKPNMGNTIDIDPAAVITGHVVNAYTGDPAAGVTVEAQGIDNGDFVTVQADADGRYTLNSLMEGTYNIWAEHDTLTCVAVDSFHVSTGQQRQAPPIKLYNGGFITGKVINEDSGQPVQPGKNADVGIYGPSRPKSGAAIDSSPVQENGTFKIQVPPGRNYIYLRPSHEWGFMNGIQNAKVNPPNYWVEMSDGQTKEVVFNIRRLSKKELEDAYRQIENSQRRMVLPKTLDEFEESKEDANNNNMSNSGFINLPGGFGGIRAEDAARSPINWDEMAKGGMLDPAQTDPNAVDSVQLSGSKPSTPQAARIESMDRLRQLRTAYNLYLDAHDHTPPAALEVLRPCLDDQARRWLADNAVLLTLDKMPAPADAAATPIAYDKRLPHTQNGTVALFADGHLEFVHNEHLKEVIKGGDFSDLPRKMTYPGNTANFRKTPEQHQAERLKNEQLLQTRIDFSPLTKKMTLFQALDQIKDRTTPPLRYIILWGDLIEHTAIDRTTPIGIEGLQTMTLKDGLSAILSALSKDRAPVDFVIEDEGIITIATKNSLPTKYRTEIYDVADILSYPGTHRKPADNLDGLKQTIIQTIVPESWQENGGEGRIDAYGDVKLLIWQTPEVHETLNKYFMNLRNDLFKYQIALETRVMLVSDIFLADIGLDTSVNADDAAANGAGNLVTGPANSDPILAAMEPKPLPEIEPSVQNQQPLDDLQTNFLLRAGQARRNVKTLTAPKVMVLNDEAADLRVQTAVPYTDTDGTEKEILKGVALNLLPTLQPNADTVLLKGHIQMTDVLDNQSVEHNGQTYEIPNLQVANIPIYTLVESGQTALIIGPELITTEEITEPTPTTTRPYNYQPRMTNKQRLLIFLKPTIIETEEAPAAPPPAQSDGLTYDQLPGIPRED